MLVTYSQKRSHTQSKHNSKLKSKSTSHDLACDNNQLEQQNCTEHLSDDHLSHPILGSACGAANRTRYFSSQPGPPLVWEIWQTMFCPCKSWSSPSRFC